LVLTLGIGVATPAIAAPVLQDYLILAGGKVTVGGGSNAIGLVGSAYTGAANQFAVTVAGAASIQGECRSAHNIQLNNGAVITGNAIHPSGTTITMGSGASVGANVIANPDLPSLPSPTSFTSGGTSYSGLPNGATLTLAPGSYGDVTLGGACTLNLSAGVYKFNSIHTGNGLDLKLDLQGGSIQVLVTTDAHFGSLDVFFTSPGSSNNVYLEAQGSGTATYSAFSAGGGSDWLGTVFAPNGGIHFGGSGCCSSFQGHFWSGSFVGLEHGLTGSGPAVAVVPTTWGAAKQLFR